MTDASALTELARGISAFMAQSPWLSWWLAWWLLFFTAWLLLGAVRLTNRVLRSINVLVRGWPPAHLDADGDWKPQPQPAADERGDHA